ncbi:MAG: head GIN domain-containing protein [Agriterribacter sp.]
MKYLFLLVACTALLAGCHHNESVNGNGNSTSQSRSTGSFKGVKLMGSMNVQITKGTSTSIEIQAEENIIPLIETYVKDGDLVIKYRDDIDVNTHNDVVVKVTAATLNNISVFGSGDINGEGLFASSEKINISVFGSGSIHLDLDAPIIKAETTGSGNIELSGNTKDAEYGTLGSGEIKAFDLKAENVVAKTLGSGDIEVFASVKLNVSISGSGGVKYKGGGTVSSSVHGSGEVSAAE